MIRTLRCLILFLFQVWSSKACGCVCKERRYRNCARRQKFVDEETCMCSKVMQGPETNQVTNPKPQQKGKYVELIIESVTLAHADQLVNLNARYKFCF